MINVFLFHLVVYMCFYSVLFSLTDALFEFLYKR